MNLDRDLECCLRPEPYWHDKIARFDESQPQECCFGWCRPCTACFCECVWCGWIKKCCAPVLEEICPDTRGAVNAVRSAEPCAACGHVCVMSIRCWKGTVTCGYRTVWSAYAVLVMLATVAVFAFSVFRYYYLASMVAPADVTMQDVFHAAQQVVAGEVGGNGTTLQWIRKAG